MDFYDAYDGMKECSVLLARKRNVEIWRDVKQRVLVFVLFTPKPTILLHREEGMNILRLVEAFNASKNPLQYLRDIFGDEIPEIEVADEKKNQK